MKNAITLLILAGFFLSFETKNIDLEEVKVKPTESFTKNLETANDEFLIPEELNDKFEINAIGFICNNFKMKEYLQENQMKGSDSYEVTFKSRKGFLRANYDINGDLVKTVQRFKNAALPYEVRNKIFNEYHGWDITKSTFFAIGTGEKMDKGCYRIIVEKGNRKERIKVHVTNNSMNNTRNALVVN
ncbi:hypothetical protein [Autumnicola edwardsiae]|uniref:Beta-lactamase-inhibitor-like PepSY-like domain-containing protein n=1 Tax=Autumnicola edwardsiae TaxID=3075594 RepID=A0ABU3CSL5_9FLAO|nr:hypothetical protein [Zunongwangia sp. F297]MDT0649350.1 hypothetical protein [Zunongwangia sp. F297]